MKTPRPSILSVVLIFGAAPVRACFWDSETMAAKAEEKQRLFGKFVSATGVLGEKWNPKKVGAEVTLMLEKGKTLNAGVRRDEMDWQKSRKDVSAEFIRKYLTH